MTTGINHTDVQIRIVWNMEVLDTQRLKVRVMKVNTAIASTEKSAALSGNVSKKTSPKSHSWSLVLTCTDVWPSQPLKLHDGPVGSRVLCERTQAPEMVLLVELMNSVATASTGSVVRMC